MEDSEPLKDATDRIKKILDAKYEKVDIDEVVDNCDQLDMYEQ